MLKMINLIIFIRYTLGSLLIVMLAPFGQKLRKRRKFEQDFGPKSIDFSSVSSIDIWMHVSSEGEWEQIWPIVEHIKYLNKKPNILILYTSPSLQLKAKVVNDKKEGIFVVALPLLDIFYWNKFGLNYLKNKFPMKTFLMVRYDFFPELFSLRNSTENFILLAGTLKNKWPKIKNNFFKKWMMAFYYRKFTQIYLSGPSDVIQMKAFFEECNIKQDHIFEHDFRHGQIINRQRIKASLLSKLGVEEITEHIGKWPHRNRIVLGSLWSHELDIFNEDFIQSLRNKEFIVLIAPHHLKGDEWDKVNDFCKALEKQGVPISLWDQNGFHGEGSVILSQVSGVLCEIYPQFGHAYVGGGFSRSIHSVLEPYWAGCHIYCGPKTHRSTEYDFVREYSFEYINTLVKKADFFGLVRSVVKKDDSDVNRNTLRERYYQAQIENLKKFEEYIY